MCIRDRFRPEVNIRYGVYVLKLLGEQFKEPDTVLAAYNADVYKRQVLIPTGL